MINTALWIEPPSSLASICLAIKWTLVSQLGNFFLRFNFFNRVFRLLLHPLKASFSLFKRTLCAFSGCLCFFPCTLPFNLINENKGVSWKYGNNTVKKKKRRSLPPLIERLGSNLVCTQRVVVSIRTFSYKKYQRPTTVAFVPLFLAEAIKVKR